MDMTINVRIPALDRLCDLLEKGAQPLFPASPTPLGYVQNPEPIPTTTAAPEPAPQPEPTPQPEPEPEPAPDPEPQPEPKKPTVTLDAIQRAAADLRDQGKLKAVTSLFPEFFIRKLSDLTPEKLEPFADRLREMGAKL